MDRIRLVTLCRTLAMARATLEQAPRTPYTWRWADGVMVGPETRCCFCRAVLRYHGILRIDSRWRHYGQYTFPRPGTYNYRQTRPRLVLRSPRFPHMITSTHVCRGDAQTPEALFASPVNLGSASMSVSNILDWYLTLFGHHCSGSVEITETIDDDDEEDL